MRYRNLIKQILSEYVESGRSSLTPEWKSADCRRATRPLPTLRTRMVERRRVRNLRVYVRLIQGKFWIEYDMTEGGTPTELLDAGVPKEDIVLAFQAPEMRPYTEFAAA